MLVGEVREAMAQRCVKRASSASDPEAVLTPPWGDSPLPPPGWFMEPVRAWKSMRFQSALFTPGSPLCVLSPAEIANEERAAALQRTVAPIDQRRPYRFRRVGGAVAPAEAVWIAIGERGGQLPEADATKLTSCSRASLQQRCTNAITAGVLVLRRERGEWVYERGAVAPLGAQPASEATRSST